MDVYTWTIGMFAIDMGYAWIYYKYDPKKEVKGSLPVVVIWIIGLLTFI